MIWIMKYSSKDQQIRSDFLERRYYRGVVKEVQLKGMKPRCLVRTSPKFLERLFEQIPEVADGLIIVKRVSVFQVKKQKLL